MNNISIYENFYVYLLLDSSKPGEYKYGEYEFTHEPFYVGKGRGNRYKNSLYDKSVFKKNKIDKLKESKIDIITIKVIENLSNIEAIEKEKELIYLIGRRDLNNGTLVNLTDGGDGGRVNSKPSIETKRKISENRKGKGVGWKHTEETKKIMSDKQSNIGNGFYGKTHSEETKEAHSNNISGNKHPMYGKKHSEETIKKMIENRNDTLFCENLKRISEDSKKEVLMFSLDGELLKEFISVKDAAISTKMNESIISKCCRGEIMTPTRYFFKYKNKNDNMKSNKYLVDIGAVFNYSKKQYILKKRNETSSICIDIETEEECTIRYKDCLLLTIKDTNDSEFMELLVFLKTLNGDFKVDKEKYLIYSEEDKIKVFYNKLHLSSDIFLSKNEIFNRYVNKEDYKVINIFEDTWRLRKEIIKSRMMNILKRNVIKIGARSCEIKEIDYKTSKEFLDRTHIQGHLRSKLNIGLFYNNKLVSLMSFGSLRKNLGQVSKENSWELLRFSNELETNVMGGASKIFKYFAEKYKPEVVISYADRCWSDGELYEKLGFNKSTNKVAPSYFYIVDNVRKNRFGYRKDILVSDGFDPNMTEVSIQHSRGYYRIFDCGCFKFEYIKE